MTVKELYEKLKLEIEAGHGDIPVIIYDNYPDTDDGCGYTVMDTPKGVYYHKPASYPLEICLGHVELRK